MKRTPTLPQKPGHILFVTGEYPPMVGGVGAYTAELGAALVARGWQVSVLTRREAQSVHAASDPITVYADMRGWGWGLFHQVAELVEKAGVDLVHVQYQSGAFDLHAAINLAPWWWRRQGIPVAWTYHDLLTPRVRKLPAVANWARDFPARVADRVISTNLGHPEYLKQFTQKLASIPIGSNITAHFFTDEERRARRTQRGYGDGDLVMGYFGFLNRGKGSINLLITLERLLAEGLSAHLLMIGKSIRVSTSAWELAHWQELQDYIQANGLQERVKFTDYQPDAEVSADLAACDLLFLPYKDGASPRRGSLMAGLTHGCAIVTTTPMMPFPGVVGGRDLLFVGYEDIAGVVTAVQKIANDPVLKATLRQNALKASYAFSWARIAEAHEQFYFSS